MTKKAHINNIRCQPLGDAGVVEARNIVKSGCASKINEVFVDVFSASALVSVFDAVGDRNKAKIISFPVARAIEISFSALRKVA